MSTLAATLRAIAAELRQFPEHWTQREWARDAKGNTVSFFYQKPISWCMYGLCHREDIAPLAMPLLTKLVRETKHSSVPDWNDAPGRTAADVADLFDMAAAKAESP